jgi:hypothetical protein
MLKTIIIQLWDNENYNYPMLEIYEKYYNDFLMVLKDYQKNPEYTYEEFILFIRGKAWFVREIVSDKKVFF